METLLVVGCTHHRTPLAVRERLTFDSLERETFLSAVGGADSEFVERVLLATCNRVEVIAATSQPAALAGQITELLACHAGLSLAEFSAYVVVYTGSAAAEHLLSVAAGLDSLVTGEPHILGQVAEAYQLAQAAGYTGPQLAALFEAAIRTGKRVRTETHIARAATSVPAAFVTLVNERLGGLADRTAVIIGAGEMAHVAGRALRSRGIGRLIFVNRTLERAERLAKELQAEAASLAELDRHLASADVVLGATSASVPVLTAQHLRQRAPAGRELLLADLGMPRNIASEITTVPGVTLLILDDLQAIVDRNAAARAAEIPRVQAIIAQEMAALHTQFAQLAIRPTLRALHRQAELVAERELARTLRTLGPVSEHEQEALRVLARSIATKLMHAPTAYLRSSAQHGDGLAAAQWAEKMFGLPNCGGIPS